MAVSDFAVPAGVVLGAMVSAGAGFLGAVFAARISRRGVRDRLLWDRQVAIYERLLELISGFNEQTTVKGRKKSMWPYSNLAESLEVFETEMTLFASQSTLQSFEEYQSAVHAMQDEDRAEMSLDGLYGISDLDTIPNSRPAFLAARKSLEECMRRDLSAD